MSGSAVDLCVARSELTDLVYRYARSIDRRDSALLLSCYHEDAVNDYGSMFVGTAAAFATWQIDLMSRYDITAHYITNALFQVQGGNAEGEIYFIGYYRMNGPSGMTGFMGGRYLDRYENRHGEWRISRRNVVWDVTRQFAADASQPAQLLELGNVGGGAGDPSYSILPLLASRGVKPAVDIR